MFMKRFLSLVLCVLMLCGAVSALAEDYTMDAFDSFTYMCQNEEIPMQEEYPETFQGKTVFGLYFNLSSDPVAVSSEMLRETGDFYMLPAEYLATSIDDADWAMLIYAVEKEDAVENESPIQVMIFAVDAKNAVFYKPYALDSRETILENNGETLDLGPTLRGWDEMVLYPEWAKLNMETDEAYRAGLEFMKDDKYYSAYECFCNSSAEYAWAMAQECLLPWPETGEVWKDWSLGDGNTELVIQVNQPEDQAMMIRIIKDGQTVSCLFVGGTGTVSKQLPAGVYTIKDGTGMQWFGYKEAFGPDGYYETMMFGDEDEVSLDAGYSYTLTVNTDEITGEGVGSDPEDWDGFAE